MQLYSVIEFSAVICAYFAVVMILPSLMFARRLRGQGLTERFLFCMVAGNFYIINVVLVIALAGISNRYVMIIALFGGALWRYFVTTDKDYISIIKHQAKLIVLLFKRQLGIRYYMRMHRRTASVFIKKINKAVLTHFRKHFFEWVLFLFVTFFNVWYFSYQTMHYYGYGASDTTVHLSWIQYMANGRVFGAGVYPHGFHCIIYMLYQCFGFKLYALMRYFGAIQSTFIVVMIYVYAKSLCRNRYTPFIAYIAFSFCQIFHTETMMRFQMTVPQEYGMLFLFPMVIYLSRFVRQADKEPMKKCKPEHKLPMRERIIKRMQYLRDKIKMLFVKVPESRFFDRESSLSITMAAISFSLTLAVHFYITICAGMICAAFAFAYIIKIFKKRIFIRLVAAVLAALFVAIAPMAYAVATGSKLEGSLRWALSIITIGSNATGQIATSEADEKKTDTSATADTTSKTTVDTSQPETETKPTETQAKAASIGKKRPVGIRAILSECYQKFVPAVMPSNWFLLTFGCLCIVLAGSSAYIVFKNSLKAREWMTMGMYIVFMFFLFNASTIGIPELMDKIRARVLVAYGIPLLFSCVFDAAFDIFSLLFIWTKRRTKIVNSVSMILCAAVISGVYVTNNIKRPSYFYYLQHNGAMICLYDIVEQYPTNKWTIVSVVDETRLVWKNGYHYEIIDFLLKQENWNSSKTLYLPTQYVFIYVEKNVLHYSSVQKANKPLPSNMYKVSERYARTPFPTPEYASKSRYYQKVDRAMIMSKMYYWAQEYQKLFPDEFSVYYEDEDFICYKIEQNEYHLNNFAINYGFNVKK